MHTLESISHLKLDDHKLLLLERLGVTEASESELQAEFDIYIAELIAEVERIADLKSRFAALSDHGLIQAQGISNPAKYFQTSILNAEPSVAEQNMLIMESNYGQSIAELNADSWLKARQVEYSKIDKMLLEALAEDYAGRPEKMNEYLELRDQIKLAHPKPEV